MSGYRRIPRLGLGVLLVAALVLGGWATADAKRFGKHGKAFIEYDLAAGAVSEAIQLPAGQAVQVIGVQTFAGNRGVGQVTIFQTAEVPFFLEWVGLESPAAAAITSGFSAVQGTHIVFLDFSHTVDIEVNDANTIRIHNSSGAQQTGNVTMIW